MGRKNGGSRCCPGNGGTPRVPYPLGCQRSRLGSVQGKGRPLLDEVPLGASDAYDARGVDGVGGSGLEADGGHEDFS